MNILLHTCCGPCAVYPLSVLENLNHSVTAYFYNPNIHPFKEFRKRLVTAEDFFKRQHIPSIMDKNYGLKYFLRRVVHNEEKRCHFCYFDRLEKTVQTATNNGFDAFTSTLLYSKYQNHKKIIELCETLAEQYSISFFYYDFREGWQQGIDISKQLSLYRQPYCGCIFSEWERYDKSLKRKNKETHHDSNDSDSH